MMEVESTSEMSVNFRHTTWRNIPDDLSYVKNFPTLLGAEILGMQQALHFTT
jgi:hypothetical protein